MDEWMGETARTAETKEIDKQLDLQLIHLQLFFNVLFETRNI